MVSWQKIIRQKAGTHNATKGVLVMDKKNQIKYINEQRDKKYDRIELIVPKGMKEKMKDRAEKLGLYNKASRPNISGYIQKLVEEDLKE